MKNSFKAFQIWNDKTIKNYEEKWQLEREELYIRDNCVKDITNLIKKLANNFNKTSTKYKIGYRTFKFDHYKNLDYGISVILMSKLYFEAYQKGHYISISGNKDMKELPVVINWSSGIDNETGLKFYNMIKKALETY